MEFKILALVFNFVLICWPKTKLISHTQTHTHTQTHIHTEEYSIAVSGYLYRLDTKVLHCCLSSYLPMCNQMISFWHDYL